VDKTWRIPVRVVDFDGEVVKVIMPDNAVMRYRTHSDFTGTIPMGVAFINLIQVNSSGDRRIRSIQ
jgi:hypothetical protein